MPGKRVLFIGTLLAGLGISLAGAPAYAQGAKTLELISKIGMDAGRLRTIEELVSVSGPNATRLVTTLDRPMLDEAQRLAVLLNGSSEEARALRTLLEENESLRTFIRAGAVSKGTRLVGACDPLLGCDVQLGNTIGSLEEAIELAARNAAGGAPLAYNSTGYYAEIFSSTRALQEAEASALKLAQSDLAVLGEQSRTTLSESERLGQIFAPYRRVNLTDFDGTRSRLEDLGEARNAIVDQRAKELVELEKKLGINTVKVSGRPLVWPEIGLISDVQNLPELAIGEAGTAMAIDGVPSKTYRSFIDARTGFDHAELDEAVQSFLRGKQAEESIVEAFRPQAQNAVTHKVAYDVKLTEGASAEELAQLQRELQALVGKRAKVVQSHFIEAENAGVSDAYRFDIVPGDKADAADYVAMKLAEDGSTLPIVTAGDSGNDIALVGAAVNAESVSPSQLVEEITSGKPLSSNVFIAVANRHPSLKAEIDRIASPASSLPGLTAEQNEALQGVYFVTDEGGNVTKVILDDAELARFRSDLPLERHGPESILNAYELIYRP